jgi:hypothetical protein
MSLHIFLPEDLPEKKIKTPTTAVRFIRYVAKISVLSPKLPADGHNRQLLHLRLTTTVIYYSRLNWIMGAERG